MCEGRAHEVRMVGLGGPENPTGFSSVQTNLTGDFMLVTQ